MENTDMADGTYVVFGATGHVGGVIADRLLSAGKKVRVVARSAGKLAALQARGAEVAAGEVTDAAFATRALQGAIAAFLLIPPPSLRPFQDQVIAALGQAVEQGRVPRVVTLSSIGADQPSGNGPIGGLHALEQRLARIPGLSALHLRAGYFLENFLGSLGMIKGMGLNGSAIHADLPMKMVAAADIGEVGARRLLALDWQGTEVQEVQGERDLTMAQATAALGAAIGKPALPYVAFPYPDAEQGMIGAGLPPELAKAYVDMARGFNEGICRSLQPRSARTTTPTSVETWARQVFAPAHGA
ncbi:MAG: NAD(P)H-binding protein [Anaeromyxobacter sp.]